MRVILGSASPRRRDILAQAGIEHEVIVSDCDEAVSEDKPEEVVKAISVKKAEDVWDKACRKYGDEDDMLIIGADTIVAVDDVIFGKPADRDDAVRMIGCLSGRTHQVYTGVTVITKEKKMTFSSCTDVSVYELTEDEIRGYVNTGEPMDKAGAYAIQGGFARYIRSINGEYNNVVGFPVAMFIHELKKEGIRV